MTQQEAEVILKVNEQEAREKFEKLEAKAKELRKQFAEAFKKGDTRAIDEINKKLRQTDKELDNMRTNAANIRAAMVRLNEASPRDLQRTIKLINNELNSGRVKRGTKEWDEYVQKLKEVKAELKNVQSEMAVSSEGALSGFANTFTRWWGTYTILTDAIDNVNMKFSQMRKDYRDKEESQANLKALTGLDDGSISWLTEQAEKLSTTMDESGLRITQSSQEILDAYMLVGSNKPELLNDKEALNEVTVEAMLLSAAAKMKLQPAVDAMTTALNQYGEGAESAARYVNVLAAGSKFGAANVEQQSASILKAGTAAASANVPIEELVGSIEMLGEKGIKGEVAGTGLKKFFLVLQTGAAETNPKVVGLSTALDNLKARVDAAESKKTGGGAALLKKMFGEEAYSIASILSANTEKVKEYTEAVTDTDTAMEQAAINSDTSAAKMAQVRNKFKEAGIELIEKLNPSLGILANWSSRLISLLPGIIDIFIKFRGTIIAFVSALIAYNLYMSKSVILDKLKVFWQAKVVVAAKAAYTTLLRHPYGILIAAAGVLIGVLIDLARAHGKAGVAAKELDGIRKQAASNMAEEKTKLDLLIAAARNENLSLEERRKAIDKLNEIIPGYNASLDDTTGKYRENEKALKDYITQLTRKYELEGAKDSHAELGKRKAKLKMEQSELEEELKQELASNAKRQGNRKPIIPSGGANMSASAMADIGASGRIGAIRSGLKGINDELYKIDAKEKVIENLYGTDLQKEAVNSSEDETKKTTKTVLSESEEERKEREKKEREARRKAKEALKKDLDERKSAYLQSEAENLTLYVAGEKNYLDYCSSRESLEKEYIDDVVKIHENHNQIDVAAYGAALKQKADLLKKHQDAERKRSAKDFENTRQGDEDAAVKDFYTPDGPLYQNKRALNERLFAIEMEYLRQLAELHLEGSEERAEIEKKIEEREAKNRLEKQKELSEAVERFKAEFGDAGRSAAYRAEIDMLELLHKKGLIKEEEYQKCLEKIRSKYRSANMSESVQSVEEIFSRLVGLAPDRLKELSGKMTEWLSGLSEEERARLSEGFDKGFDNIVGKTLVNGLAGVESLIEGFNDASEGNWENLIGRLGEMAENAANIIGGIMSTFSSYWSAQRDVELAEIEKRYDREIDAAGKNTKKKEKLEKQKEAEIAKTKKKYNDRAMKMEIAQAIAQTAANALGAYGAMVKIPVVGPALAAAAAAMATAAGAIQIATIKKQHEAQAAGYYEGGFTSRNPDNRKTVGVVHANEFVANHKAVANPALAPVLQLIDHAQRNNTVGSLTAADVSHAIGTRPGVGPGGGTGSDSRGATEAFAGSVALMADMTASTRAAIDRLSDNIESGIEAYMVMDGERGFYKKYEHYKRLNNNPKR